MNISNTIKRAIEKSKLSRYEISKRADLDPAALHRFFHGERGLAMDSLDRLAETLGLELRPKAKRKGKGRATQGGK